MGVAPNREHFRIAPDLRALPARADDLEADQREPVTAERVVVGTLANGCKLDVMGHA